jgi:enoyl-CoA hydratase/carnithine racemase
MIRREDRAGTTWVTFDRPERLNAFTAPDYRDVREAVERATDDPAVHALALTGTGRAFTAGADRSLVDGTATAADRDRASVEFRALLEALGQCDKPVLAAVNGLAVGLGCTILLHCDLVLVAESARLRLPFTALGMVPEAGSSVLLPARARWGDAVWSMLSSEWIEPATALDMGLAWRVLPDADLVSETERAAATIGALDAAAVAASKRLLTAGRAEIVRAAIDREHEALVGLLAARETDVARGGGSGHPG